jgi:hypothetical protein
MNTQSTLSYHGVHLSVLESGASRGEGVRQDKSRTLLGGRMGKKSRNNNVRGKGAHGSITSLNAIIRWELCELHTLRINAP